MTIQPVRLYRSITLEPNGGGAIFANKSSALRFDPTGRLCSMTLGKQVFTLKETELTFVVGGKYRSTIDTEGKNKNWASLMLSGAETYSPDFEYLNHKLKRTHNRAELHMTVLCKLSSAELEVTKIYSMSADDPGFNLRFELHSRGTFDDDDTMLHYMTAALPSADGEVKVKNIGNTSRFLEFGDKTLSVWCDPRFENNSVGSPLNYKVTVEQPLNCSEDIIVGSVSCMMVKGSAIDAARYVREQLEIAGLRGRGEFTSMLSSLQVYEVEIGPLRLSETKCHHRYDHPGELADDLMRIRDLGFNTVEMMPSFLFPCYSVFDLRNPDIQHGAGESIRPVIEEAHRLGMKVILDVLLHGCIDREIAAWNLERYSSRRFYWPEWLKRIPEFHDGNISPLREKHPDWFLYEKPGLIFRGYTWTFDHASHGFRDYLIESMNIAVRDWGIDGFRYDAPTWQSGINSAPDLPYSGADSLCYGHWIMFRELRESLSDVERELVWIVEGPYYPYADSCDMSYSYDLSSISTEVCLGKKTARDMQKYCELREAFFPRGAVWLNFADNHDTWNNGVVEDGLYRHERLGTDKAKAIFSAACFHNGGIQAFGGFEDPATSEGTYADYARAILRLRSSLAGFFADSIFSYSTYTDNENVICMQRTNRESGEVLICLVNYSDSFQTASAAKLKDIVLAPWQTKVFMDARELVIE